MSTKRKNQPEAIPFAPVSHLSADDFIDLICEGNASQDFVFALIVGLEKAMADGDFLERVCKHFSAELKEQEKSS